MSLKRDFVPSVRPVVAKEAPLVDRTEEMDILKEAVYRAVHAEGGLVLLHGEAGIGKARLIRELGAYAQSRGVRVLYGRCPALFRMDGVPPYILWKEVIRDYLEICSPEQLYRRAARWKGQTRRTCQHEWLQKQDVKTMGLLS